MAQKVQEDDEGPNPTWSSQEKYFAIQNLENFQTDMDNNLCLNCLYTKLVIHSKVVIVMWKIVSLFCSKRFVRSLDV